MSNKRNLETKVFVFVYIIAYVLLCEIFLGASFIPLILICWIFWGWKLSSKISRVVSRKDQNPLIYSVIIFTTILFLLLTA